MTYPKLEWVPDLCCSHPTWYLRIYWSSVEWSVVGVIELTSLGNPKSWFSRTVTKSGMIRNYGATGTLDWCARELVLQVKGEYREYF
jgi:hypothetical protein